MKKRIGKFFAVLCYCFFLCHCSSSSPTSNPPLLSPPSCLGSQNASVVPVEPSSFSGLTFTPVGGAFPSSELIDLEFLGSQNGDAIVIAKDGTVFYMRNDFTPLASVAKIPVQDQDEQGMLNVAADPNYASNCFVYFYYTPPGGGLNRVSRGTVNLDLGAQTFSITDLQMILELPKSDSHSPGTNHNGGSLLFQNTEYLLIGVGDGGGGSSGNMTERISQRESTRLGKILRVSPSRTPGVGGFTMPSGGNPLASSALPEIYILGLRNPFTMTLGNGGLFIGDVGQDLYEEVDLSKMGGENFGWPLVEGPAPGSGFVDPLSGYNHTTDLAAFIAQDSLGSDPGGESVMVNHFYNGPRYKGLLTNRLIYSEFFAGFIRGILLDGNNNKLSETPLGHLSAMTSLQQGPDGFLYAVSLFNSNQILRLELTP